MTPASPEEVCRAISLDLKARGITQQQVADRIGKSRAIVSNALASKKRFSKKLALLLCEELGYNLEYLLFGVGELKADFTHATLDLPTTENRDNDYLLLAAMLQIAEGIIQTIGDRDAVGAWTCINVGDLDGYKECIARLRSRSNSVYYFSPLFPQIVCSMIKNKKSVSLGLDSNEPKGE